VRKSLLPADPLTPAEHMRQGTVYEGQGELSEAWREYGAALREDRAFLPAVIALGNLAFARADLIEAEIYYRKALKLDSEQPSANNNLAVVYLTRGSRLETAQKLAETALKKAGALRPYVLDTLANVYMREGRYKDAKAALDQAEVASGVENPALKRHLLESRRHLDSYTALR